MNKLYGYENKIKNNNIISIQVNLLNKCTSHCKSCVKNTWPDSTLSFSKLKNALLILKNIYKLETVVFSGGDPLLYPHMKDLIEFCVRARIKFSLITTLITKDRELLCMIAKHAERIHVSLDSAGPVSYKEIRGVDGFDIVDENVKYIQKIRLANNSQSIRFSATISKMNYNQTYPIFRYAAINMCNLNYYLVHTWDNLKMSKKEIDIFYSELSTIAQNKEIITNAESLIESRYMPDDEITDCHIPYVHALINANGDIYPCCRLLNDNGPYTDQSKYAYGNIYKENIMAEFDRRLSAIYPLNCELCKGCGEKGSGDRYRNVIKDINEILNNEKKPLFF